MSQQQLDKILAIFAKQPSLGHGSSPVDDVVTKLFFARSSVNLAV